MSGISEVAWLTLGHEIESSMIAGPGIRTTYQTATIRVERPGRGVQLIEVVCDHCGVVLRLRVPSVRRAKNRRRLWALMAVVILVVTGQLVYELFLRDPVSPLIDSALVEVGAFVAIPIAPFVFILALARSRYDLGIRIKTSRARRLHRLLP